MMYLHQHHAIHRDLKPGNILFDDNLEPHITDFGLAKFVSAEEMKNTISTGTYAYMAPEVIDNGNYNGKSDVYSFGILMYEVVTDSIPYPEFQQQKITPFRLNLKILNEDYRPKFTVPVKDKIRKLIENCWSKDPNDRPTFEEIYNRLSRNIEESVYNVFENEDSEYFLEDVDADEIFMYLDKIENDDENRSNIDLSQLEETYSKIRQLTIENDQMKQKMQNLESKTAEFISKVDRLTIENNSMKQTIIQLNSKIDFLTAENKQVKSLSSSQNEKSSKVEDTNEVRLHINIYKADIIELLNPFVQLILKSQCKKDFQNTSVVKDTKNPVWNEEFNFFTTNPNDILLIRMFNQCGDYDSKLIDEIEYPISNLRVGDPLVKQNFKIAFKKNDFGRLYIQLQLFRTVKSDIETFCTFSVTGNHPIKQKFYRCLTCNLTDENRSGVCESCAKNCHKGHDLRYAYDRKHGFYCDCPKKCGCHCLQESKDLICTSVENDGKKINQPMYYCSSCDEEKKSLICQNCAMKYHHGHNIVYLGIVESCSCQFVDI